MSERITVAIDGPAGVGKSTVARRIAEKLGYLYIDTGAMYRAVGLWALRANVALSDMHRLEQLANEARIEFGPRSGSVLLNGEDVTEAIRAPEIAEAASKVSLVPAVRRALVAKQREIGERASVVMEGRDIGTVVFPGAPVKVYMTASDEERAQRRSQEMLDMHYDEVAADIARRDHIDSTRRYAPLAAAPDAVVVDTTTSTVDQVVELVLQLAVKAGLV